MRDLPRAGQTDGLMDVAMDVCSAGSMVASRDEAKVASTDGSSDGQKVDWKAAMMVAWSATSKAVSSAGRLA